MKNKDEKRTKMKNRKGALDVLEIVKIAVVLVIGYIIIKGLFGASA